MYSPELTKLLEKIIEDQQLDIRVSSFSSWLNSGCNPFKIIRICSEYRLSNEFLFEFKDKLFWETICSTQNLSFNLVQKYIDHVMPSEILSNKNISCDTKIKICNSGLFDLTSIKWYWVSVNWQPIKLVKKYPRLFDLTKKTYKDLKSKNDLIGVYYINYLTNEI